MKTDYLNPVTVVGLASLALWGVMKVVSRHDFDKPESERFLKGNDGSVLNLMGHALNVGLGATTAGLLWARFGK